MEHIHRVYLAPDSCADKVLLLFVTLPLIMQYIWPEFKIVNVIPLAQCVTLEVVGW